MVHTSHVHFLNLFHPGEDSREVSHFRDERVELREVQCHGRAGTQTQGSLTRRSRPNAALHRDRRRLEPADLKDARLCGRLSNICSGNVSGLLQDNNETKQRK